MKVFEILVTGLLILVIASTSLSYASPRETEYRIPSLLSWFYRNVLAYTGICPVYIELHPVDGPSDGVKVGGDADDYANGRDEGFEGDDSKKEKLKSDGRSPLGPADGGKKIIKPSGLR
jgi:hypothetical protein